MKKLVALEKIFGLMSKIVYAEKHDELEHVRDHDEEIGVYRNIRTKEIIFSQKERVGEIEQSDIFFFVDETEKKQKQTKQQKKSGADKTNQLDIFK